MTVYGPYPAQVVSVHDGDTARLLIDLGFQVSLSYSCRVYGIDAPELNTAEGKASRDYAQTLMAPGDLVHVVSHGWDAYGGRFDGEIRLADGTDFATRMVDSGHAVRKSYR